MILADTKTDVQAVNIGQTAQATIKASARLFNFFSDMIYSDKYVAIWRELVANGMDAHTVAGRKDRAMIVTLPTDYTPYAKVRDFGTGMSEVFLVGDANTPSKFMAYTDASTKENSNDFIGGFGIGSKAPLSYTEQFAIRSYQNGVCKVYSIYKDEEGCPRITKLAEDTTTEEDGIEISFPVEGKDIKAFRDAVPKTLEYFSPQPQLVNSAQQLAPIEYTVKTHAWGFRRGADESRVIQGGIAYPISHGSVPGVDDLLSFGVDFFMPIGSCSIALSREQLSYDDRTVRTIKAMADAMKPDLEKHVSAMFANCTSRWEAEALYGTEISTTHGPRQAMIRQHAFWRGKKLSGRFNRTSMPAKIASKLQAGFVTSDRYSRANYQNWTEGLSNPTIRAWLADVHAKDVSVLLIDDGPQKPVMRVRRYLEENDIRTKGVMILRPMADQTMSKMDWARLVLALGRIPYRLLSTIEPAVATAYSRGPSRAEKIRAYKSDNFRGPASNGKFTDQIPDSGYYMEMEAFHVKSGQATPDQLQASGLLPADIYYFNKGDFAKIKNKPKWKPALYKFTERMETYRKDHPNIILAKAMNAFMNQYYEYGSTKKWKYALEIGRLLGSDCPAGPMQQLVDKHNLVKAELTPADAAMRNLMKLDSTVEYVLLESLAKDVAATYPELWALINYRQMGPTRDLLNVYKKLI